MPYFATHIEFYFCWVPDFKVYRVHYDVIARTLKIEKRTRIGWKDAWEEKTVYKDVDCFTSKDAENFLIQTAGL